MRLSGVNAATCAGSAVSGGGAGVSVMRQLLGENFGFAIGASNQRFLAEAGDDAAVAVCLNLQCQPRRRHGFDLMEPQADRMQDLHGQHNVGMVARSCRPRRDVIVVTMAAPNCLASAGAVVSSQ